MTTKNPRNGLSFDDLNTLLYNASKEGKDRIFVGNNTYVEWITDDFDADVDIADGMIVMVYHDTKIVNFLDENTVQLFDGGFKTTTTGRRMDWALLPLGFRLSARSSERVRWGNNHDEFKIYSIKTGAYRDYSSGMIVERGAF